MYSKRLTFINKEGNIDPITAYVHNKESVKEYVKRYHSKGYIVIIEDSPLPNADCHTKDYRKAYRL